MGIAETAATSRRHEGEGDKGDRYKQWRDGSTSHNSGMCHSFCFACRAVFAVFNLAVACIPCFSSIGTA
ncbi:hypothetical protein CGRA01v4_10027 [Colletotrichum graminicola]|nr:hypothetical protein CGRA01v4_10027 [Colletotrichum graminicola]